MAARQLLVEEKVGAPRYHAAVAERAAEDAAADAQIADIGRAG